MIKLKIKELAEEKGLNMSQLQRKSGLTMSQIRRYWNNETTSIELDSLERLVHVLDCATAGELLEIVADDNSRRLRTDKFVTPENGVRWQ